MDRINYFPSKPKDYSSYQQNETFKKNIAIIVNRKFRLRLPFMINNANTSTVKKCKTQHIEMNPQEVQNETKSKLPEPNIGSNQFLDINLSQRIQNAKKNNFYIQQQSFKLEKNITNSNDKRTQIKTVGHKRKLYQKIKILAPIKLRRQKCQIKIPKRTSPVKMISSKNGQITFSPAQYARKQFEYLQ